MLSVIAALIILLVGLTTTMIEVDARIKSLNFFLLGTNISFKNQVLFFQSKSIVDVVRILIQNPAFMFQYFFPVCKTVMCVNLPVK